MLSHACGTRAHRPFPTTSSSSSSSALFLKPLPLSRPHFSPNLFARGPWRTPASMSSGDIFCPYPLELIHESDFDKIVSSDGLVSVCGFGSLLSGPYSCFNLAFVMAVTFLFCREYSVFAYFDDYVVGRAERSARSTFPELINFRIGKLSGFRRVFAHVAPIFFERGIAKPETKEISSLSVEPCDGESLIITIFEIPKSEIPSFIEREHEFRFLVVVPETINGLFYTNPAVLCARYSDEEYFQNRCKGNQEIFFQRYGRYGIQKIWHDDILPCRVYLRHCVLAAENLGDLVYNNFVDHTFLADRKTTIRDYLATTGSGIMEEEPPGPLKFRYGG